LLGLKERGIGSGPGRKKRRRGTVARAAEERARSNSRKRGGKMGQTIVPIPGSSLKSVNTRGRVKRIKRRSRHLKKPALEKIYSERKHIECKTFRGAVKGN